MTKEKTKEELVIEGRLKDEIIQDLADDVVELSSKPEPKITNLVNSEQKTGMTNMYSHGSGGGIDDEYYINEIIGLDDFTYDDWIGDKRLNEQQREEIARKYFYKERADKEKK